MNDDGPIKTIVDLTGRVSMVEKGPMLGSRPFIREAATRADLGLRYARCTVGPGGLEHLNT